MCRLCQVSDYYFALVTTSTGVARSSFIPEVKTLKVYSMLHIARCCFVLCCFFLLYSLVASALPLLVQSLTHVSCFERGGVM